MPELVLTELCPGCQQESGLENPLRAQPGSFHGMYCLKPGTEDRVHVYADTSELRQELTKINKKGKAKAASPREKAESKPPPAPSARSEERNAQKTTELVPAVEGGEQQGVRAEASAELKQTPESPGGFTVNAEDVARLSELLGQPVTDGASLVGSCYSLRMTVAADVNLEERRAAAMASMSADPQAIAQKADGTLTLQVFFPWTPTGKSLVDKAVFNGLSLNEIVQSSLEYLMAGGNFPWAVQSKGVIEPPYDGFWVAVTVPENYVGALLDKATEFNVPPQQYLQAYVQDEIASEHLT